MGGVSFSSIFSEFATDFSTVWSFIEANGAILAMVALPLGAFAVGVVVKILR